MLAMQELIGKEGDSAERVRKFRENKRLALQCNTDVTKCNTEIEIESESESESESEKEKEKEKESESESESETAMDFKEENKVTIGQLVEAYQKHIGNMEMKILTEMTLLIKEENIKPEEILDAIYKASTYGAKTWKYVCTILSNRNGGCYE